MAEITSEAKEHLQSLFAAIAQVGEHRDALISLELRQRLPEYEQAEAQAAARVQELWEALREPEQVLEAINNEIAHAQDESAQWREKLSSAGQMDDRVTARAWLTEWDEQVKALSDKKSLLESELEPVRELHQQAKRDAEEAASLRQAYELNLAIPMFAKGQQTDSFRAWYLEYGNFVPVLLAGDKSSHLWDAAVSFMDVVCLRSGYRTDGLPTDAESVRRSIENYAAARQKPDTAPSAREVMALDGLQVQEMIAAKASIRDVRTIGPMIPMGR